MMRFSLALTTLLLSLSPLAAEKFSDEVWKANEDIYKEILRHPFLKELQAGTLSKDVFAFYIVQDLFYLREFAKALNETAEKAPKEDWKVLLRRHARETIKDEQQLHARIYEEYDITPEREAAMEPAPEAFAYTNFMLATTGQGTFAEGITALLPCYWIYWEVGKELSKEGSRDDTYQTWIDAYASEGYGKVVQEILDIVNAVAAEATQEQLAQMRKLYRRGCRYEWMFWDSAYHLKKWPPGKANN